MTEGVSQFQVSFQIGDGPLFVASHIGTKVVGSQIVCAFVADDETVQTPSGVQVVFTATTARTLDALLTRLTENSPSVEAARTQSPRAPLPPPRPYETAVIPARAVLIQANVFEEGAIVFLAFGLLDPFDAPKVSGDEKPMIMAPSVRVSLSTDMFVGWVAQVLQLVEGLG